MSTQLSFLRAELRELNEAIAATEEAVQDSADGFAWELSLDSLRARRKELLAEIRAEMDAVRTTGEALRSRGR